MLAIAEGRVRIGELRARQGSLMSGTTALRGGGEGWRTVSLCKVSSSGAANEPRERSDACRSRASGGLGGW